MRNAAVFAFVLLISAMNSKVATAQSAPFVDWTSINRVARTVSGTLDSTPVTFSWTADGNVQATWFNNNLTGFNSDAFTPKLALTDGFEIVGRKAPLPIPVYTVSFGAPVLNPIMHIASNASTLTFAGATPQFVSGDSRFSVSGNQVIGSDYNAEVTDANGTVMFQGNFSSLSFTAEYFGPPPPDPLPDPPPTRPTSTGSASRSVARRRA